MNAVGARIFAFSRILAREHEGSSADMALAPDLCRKLRVAVVVEAGVV
jgi:hypothetical protein